jgi:(2R)-ethylmalonyl-CoA mutase
MRELTERIESEAWAELTRVLDMGGSVAALGYMKERLVANLARRLREIESGERPVVGVNVFPETEPSPLGGSVEDVERIDQATEEQQIERLRAWRASRGADPVRRALAALRAAAEEGSENLVPASIECAKVGVTTGEWAGALRDVFGEFRAPTGVSGAAPASGVGAPLEEARRRVAGAAARRGVPRLRLLVAKPGLDGHSNAAEQVAVRARDCGFEVVYQGIRLTPAAIARAAADEDVHAVGLSILSGAHLLLVPEVLRCLRADGVDPERVPVVVGGVIPPADAAALRDQGVARVFTPLDHDLTASVAAIADLI